MTMRCEGNHRETDTFAIMLISAANNNIYIYVYMYLIMLK